MTKASICVYCGSRPGVNPAYVQEARALGAGLAPRDWRLVYGAGDVGLMGEVARAAQTAGAETFGVIPTHLLDWEVGKRDLTRFVVTETMHERKKVMFVNSDAVVVLPGGGGTLDEFFEVLTWRQLGLHAKPIVLVNVDGYWDPLLDMIENIVTQGFTDRAVAEMITPVGDAEGALNALGQLLP
ncbi:LOG family protein [Pseudooceanicola algae]|uniref:Cytokinin riboside 5'-monophosphate phosphoribohydrolase n=1 Tax=Pseudooceanicola algae TaxID=1537215 RepID=A0A418SC57_9RHOB|nr:TIGR00730 family Rossman fold protein [Pseudooceanicola algae]QPM89985.1 Putative cytokinin riboside 5'-monophosphate phosphoribohydrolase [Pseudooceanicola algae]